ncbi:MAG: hypothetical protein ACLR8P_17175 [Clostridium fessum]
MTTVIQNSGIQLGWNRMRKRRNPALDRNETVRKKRSSQSQDAQKREEERRDNETLPIPYTGGCPPRP